MQRIEIEYGKDTLTVPFPIPCDIKGMRPARAVKDPGKEILASFREPAGSLPLSAIVRDKLKKNKNFSTTIVVSDNTRPVPYRGKSGILYPLLQSLISAGCPENNITLLIGNGSHRYMTGAEIETMLGIKEGGFSVRVVQHDYENNDDLVYVGKTKRNSPVHINKQYAKADLKIVTGLVESHFMAGASGGRKGICPGIASKETLGIFHGPEILGSPHSADLVLKGNPCHEEAEQAARLAGCDFAINVTLDAEKKITGIFSGDIFASHSAAVKKIREYVVVQLEKAYDFVLIPAGFVGVNHYQAAKAAIEASRAVKPGGVILIVARHTDPDPIGSPDYKKTLGLLKQKGPAQFYETITSPEWTFTHDQWETQMWSKVLGKTGSENNLIYCSLEIPADEYSIIPSIPGHTFIDRKKTDSRNLTSLMESIITQSVISTIRRLGEKNKKEPDIVLLKDGPYGIPEIIPPAQQKE
jgi:lactate racemase